MGNLFGARYYDARTSVWQSPDPILEKYLPTGSKEQDAKLPGMGGVRNSLNLAMYTYGHQNPIKFVDPDGNDIFLYFYSSQQSVAAAGSGSGHVAIGVGTLNWQSFYEANPDPSGNNQPMHQPTMIEGSMEYVLSKSDYAQHGQPSPDLILRLTTTKDQDDAAKKALVKFFNDNPRWEYDKSNCADTAKTALRATNKYNAGRSVVSTPQQLASDIKDFNVQSLNNGDIKTVKGNWQKYIDSTGAIMGVVKKGIGDWLEK